MSRLKLITDRQHARLPTTCNFCKNDITDIPYYSIRNSVRLNRQYHLECYPADSRPKVETSLPNLETDDIEHKSSKAYPTAMTPANFVQADAVANGHRYGRPAVVVSDSGPWSADIRLQVS